MKSEKIIFEKLSNTRDLGGMLTKSGKKICKGKLFRSGIIYGAPQSDLEKLSQLVELIIDFRTSKELTEKPDPAIDGINNLHLPIMRELTDGITREKQASASVIKKYSEDPDGAKRYMINIYKNFVTDELPLFNYSKFINILLEPRAKGVLWHCTAGKDRAGFGAVILQELLGVDKESIIEDYLYTNSCLRNEIKLITMHQMHKHNIDSSNLNKTILFQNMIDSIFTAKEEYLSGLYDKIYEIYGSFDGFVYDGLNITDKQINELRKIYLC